MVSLSFCPQCFVTPPRNCPHIRIIRISHRSCASLLRHQFVRYKNATALGIRFHKPASQSEGTVVNFAASNLKWGLAKIILSSPMLMAKMQDLVSKSIIFLKMGKANKYVCLWMSKTYTLLRLHTAAIAFNATSTIVLLQAANSLPTSVISAAPVCCANATIFWIHFFLLVLCTTTRIHSLPISPGMFICFLERANLHSSLTVATSTCTVSTRVTKPNALAAMSIALPRTGFGRATKGKCLYSNPLKYASPPHCNLCNTCGLSVAVASLNILVSSRIIEHAYSQHIFVLRVWTCNTALFMIRCRNSFSE